MARRGTETRRLTGQVLVRLTADQQVGVARRAAIAQVSVATWMRRLIADAINVDPGPVTSRAHPPELVLEVAHLREVVAEIGGALVQAAIVTRQGGRETTHADIETLIPVIKSAVIDLDAVKEKLWRPAA